MGTTIDIDLAAKLAAARGTLSRLIDRREECGTLAQTLARELVTAEAAEKLESESALIESRDPDAKVLAAAGPLRSRWQGAEAARQTAAGAVTRQQSAIAEVQAAIDARAHARAMAAIEGPQREFNEALELILARAAKLDDVMLAHNGALGSYEMFPGSPPGDPFAPHGSERSAARQMFWQLVRMVRMRERLCEPGYRWRAA